MGKLFALEGWRLLANACLTALNYTTFQLGYLPFFQGRRCSLRFGRTFSLPSIPRIHQERNQAYKMELFTKAWLIAGLFSFLACLVSFYLVYKHLRNYTAPAVQKYIVRILLMVPVCNARSTVESLIFFDDQIYAIDSWLSLRFIDYALYFNLVR